MKRNAVDGDDYELLIILIRLNDVEKLTILSGLDEAYRNVHKAQLLLASTESPRTTSGLIRPYTNPEGASLWIAFLRNQ